MVVIYDNTSDKIGDSSAIAGKQSKGTRLVSIIDSKYGHVPEGAMDDAGEIHLEKEW